MYLKILVVIVTELNLLINIFLLLGRFLTSFIVTLNEFNLLFGYFFFFVLQKLFLLLLDYNILIITLKKYFLLFLKLF